MKHIWRWLQSYFHPYPCPVYPGVSRRMLAEQGVVQAWDGEWYYWGSRIC